jgi:DMSO/TMAO reductase YedYZ molybdopterin-dependent catalytic subunit
MQAAAGAAVGAAGALAFPWSEDAFAQTGVKLPNVAKSPLSTTGEKINPYRDITTYNNFYEYGTDKEDPAQFAPKRHKSKPWTLTLDGEVVTKKTLDYDALFKIAPLEERVYRMRCVEGWSVVVPWAGVPLSALLKQVEPTGKAKYVAFESAYAPAQMLDSREAGIDFPYVEGLRLDEAMHPLTILAVGLYGEALPAQPLVAEARGRVGQRKAGPNLRAVWLDHRGAGMEIWSARSPDGGATWANNVLVYASPAGHVCECCHPFVTADAKGGFHVLFRNWLDGSRDIWTVASADGGTSFSAGQKLGTGTWLLDGCPMAGPWAAPGRISLETVWKREGTLFASRPGEPETRLAEGDQPVVASDASGAYRLWTREKKILVLAPGAGKPRTLGPGVYAAAAGSPDGRGPVVAVWQAPGEAGGVSVLPLAPRR